MKLTINDRNKESIELESSYNKQLKDLDVQLDGIERRYVIEGMAVGLYQKYKAEFEDKIEAINREKANLGLTISNLDKKLDKCIQITQDMSDYWTYSSTDIKVRIQKLVFPSGFVIDPIKREYRTSEVNSVFALISSITMGRGHKSKNASTISSDASCLVAGTGLEPVTFGL